jgi:putative phosphoesterase
MNIGLISDTHGLLRPQALAALRGSELILHAGDIGAPEVLSALEAIAPLVAVRGNNDVGCAWARQLPETATIEAGGRRLHLLHDLKTLALDPPQARCDVVISGHSHRPKIERRGTVLFVNPGSAGPRRFSLPVALARLRIDEGGVEAELLELA